MNTIIIAGKKIYTSKGLKSGAILIDEGKISKILPDIRGFSHDEIQVIDVGNNIVIPGLIDIHIHGCGGWSAEGDKSQIIGMEKYLSSRGITSFQPTIGEGTVEEIKNSLRNLKSTIKDGCFGSRILGIHMEGPFLNPEKKGAFVVENLLKPSVELMEEFIDLSGNNIIHVTLAPELEGAKKLISFLSNRNILVSGGHTDATMDETKVAINCGIRLSNHTCNAQRPIHHREPGALGAYLLDDRVDCELICDLFHVHPDMIKIIVKLKTVGRVCMISDSILASGLQPGKYNFFNHNVFVDNEGWCRLQDMTIAGSTKDLMYGLKNMVQKMGFSMEDALKMSSLNPARISGCISRKGSIEEGKDADIVVIDNDFNVMYTFVEGRMTFDHTVNENLINPAIKPVSIIK